MPTIQRQVAASNADAVEDDDNTAFSSVGVTLIITNSSIAGVRSSAGFLFTGVAVPNAAVITAASLEVWPTTSDDPDNMTLRGNDVDNAANFTDEADVTNRALTTASIAWPGTNIGTGAFKTSPDIASIVQEIVNRAGWASGNDMMILLKGRAGGTNSLTVRAWDGTPAEAAKLNITYASQGGSGGGGQGQGKGTGGGSSGGGGGIGKDKDKGGGKGPPGTIDRYLVGSRNRRRIGVL